MRRAVLSTLTLATLLFMALSWRSYATSSSAPAVEQTAAGILSPRRMPQLISAQIQDADIRSTISETINGARLGTAGDSMCVLVQAGQRVVAAKSADQALTPASTLKLLTGSAALERFGNDTTFTTEVGADDKPDDGIVSGALYLVGGGDPLLVTNDYVQALQHDHDVHTSLEALADRLVQAGVKEVRGGIVGDGGRFDDASSVATWPTAYVTQGQVGSLGGLVVNQGYSLATGSKTPSSKPAEHAAAAFADVLRARGVKVSGVASVGAKPKGFELLASIQSPPLHEIVSEMLTYSDNTTAEILVKNLGAAPKGDLGQPSTQGNTANGITVIKQTLIDQGIPIEGLVMNDGSGLDAADKATCRTFAEVLGRAGPDGSLATALPHAGETGTLFDRMTNSAAVGHVRAKTGTLSNVSSLAGWVTRDNAETLSFVIINNALPSTAGRVVEDSLAIALARATPGPESVNYQPGSVS